MHRVAVTPSEASNFSAAILGELLFYMLFGLSLAAGMWSGLAMVLALLVTGALYAWWRYSKSWFRCVPCNRAFGYSEASAKVQR